MKLSNWISLFSLIIAIILIWSLRDIIIQIFASIVIATCLCSLTDKLKSFFVIPRFVALVITLSSIIVILGVIILIVVPQFTSELQQLINQLPSAINLIWEMIKEKINNIFLTTYNDTSENIVQENIVKNLFLNLPDGASLANGVTESISKLLVIASNLGFGILQFIFIISVSIMITVQPNAYKEVFILLVPSFYRRKTRKILIKCGNAITNWMSGVLISSTLVALLAGLGLYILGVKLVIANALLAGILNFIPNVGPTLSTIFPMSVAFLDAPWKALAVLLMYIIIQNIESYLITPSVMHKQVKLLPGLALSAQFIFTIIFGPIGLLLALPLAVVIQVLTKEIIIEDVLDYKNTLQLK